MIPSSKSIGAPFSIVGDDEVIPMCDRVRATGRTAEADKKEARAKAIRDKRAKENK